MSTRRKSRELALQCLYQGELTNRSPVETFTSFCEHFEVNKKAIPYARELVEGVTARQSGIDRLIQSHAANWRLGRMPVIDRNILRLATFELCQEGMPASVAINEALEIAKRYSTDESAAFINGILDAIKKSVLAGKDSIT